MPGRLRRFVFRRLLPVLFAVLGGVAGMGVSYAVVRHLTRSLTLVPAVDQKALFVAKALRAQTNQMILLMLEFLDHVPLDAKAPPPETFSWIQRDFSPRAQSFRAALDAAPAFPGPPGLRSELRAAAERISNMAAHPGDLALRKAALGDVRRSAQHTEEYITQLGMDRYITEPARLPWLPAA